MFSCCHQGPWARVARSGVQSLVIADECHKSVPKKARRLPSSSDCLASARDASYTVAHAREPATADAPTRLRSIAFGFRLCRIGFRGVSCQLRRGTSVPVSVHSKSHLHIWSGLQRPPPNIQAQGPRFDAHLASRSVHHPCRQASIMYHRAGARVTLAAFAACMLAQSDAFQAPLPISSGAALPGIPEPTAGPASNEVRSGLRLL